MAHFMVSFLISAYLEQLGAPLTDGDREDFGALRRVTEAHE